MVTLRAPSLGTGPRRPHMTSQSPAIMPLLASSLVQAFLLACGCQGKVAVQLRVARVGASASQGAHPKHAPSLQP